MTQTELQIIMVILVVLGVGVSAVLAARRRLNYYWSRSCAGAEWRKRFPNAAKEAIREFLQCFIDGFAFNNRQRLKFRPDDKIMDVYRALYPSKGWPDALELESYSKHLQTKYRLDLAKVFTDELTLGQIFKMTTEAGPNQAITGR